MIHIARMGLYLRSTPYLCGVKEFSPGQPRQRCAMIPRMANCPTCKAIYNARKTRAAAFAVRT